MKMDTPLELKHCEQFICLPVCGIPKQLGWFPEVVRNECAI